MGLEVGNRVGKTKMRAKRKASCEDLTYCNLDGNWDSIRANDLWFREP
jgi:hypothetical protein